MPEKTLPRGGSSGVGGRGRRERERQAAASEATTRRRMPSVIGRRARRPVASRRMTDGLVAGPDGALRCWWGASTPDYVAYHDEEWGKPVRDDRGLYERLCLEAFQSGLSWLTILRKREAFRAAFAGFEPERGGRVRRRRRRAADGRRGDRAQPGEDRRGDRQRAGRRPRWSATASRWPSCCGRSRPSERPAPRTMADVPAVTPESTAMAKELKRRGFRFVGPTTAYALMQACGLVNDHLDGCLAR